MVEAVSLIGMAAAGDHDAQAAARDEFLTQANLAAKGASPYAAPASDLMLCAELHARLAANHPEATGFDQFTLASILLLRAGSCRTVPALETYADVMEEEGRALLNALLEGDREFAPGIAWLLSTLADAGDEWAATALWQLTEAMPADEAAIIAATVSAAVSEHNATQEA